MKKSTDQLIVDGNRVFKVSTVRKVHSVYLKVAENPANKNACPDFYSYATFFWNKSVDQLMCRGDITMKGGELLEMKHVCAN